ncbi:hypothetical protein J6590_032211 [Homalodisca vitripennis]|nr:hypothetical protein J6590_032211 [Homalodisca vitripennis]
MVDKLSLALAALPYVLHKLNNNRPCQGREAPPLEEETSTQNIILCHIQRLKECKIYMGYRRLPNQKSSGNSSDGNKLVLLLPLSSTRANEATPDF